MEIVKALFFLNSFAGGGAEKVCINLARQLYELGIESVFVTIYNNEPDYDIPDYIKNISIGMNTEYSLLKKIIYIIRSTPKVDKYISDKEYVLITAHLPMSHVLASLTKRGKECLYVMHVTQQLSDQHNSWIYKMVLRWFLRKRKIVTVSEGMKEELHDEYGIPFQNIKTIYNPCNTFYFCRKQKLNIIHDRQYILVVGRLEEQKKPLLALELFYRGRFYDSYDLIYLGKGSLEEKLKEKIAKYNLQKYVFLAGFQKDLRPWLANASLLLSCSSQEGLPLNLVEALICGIPVVASDCPHGPNEILTDELSNFLIHPQENPQESISVILSALKHYPEITEKYYKKFDARLVTEIYLEFWKRNFG